VFVHCGEKYIKTDTMLYEFNKFTADFLLFQFDIMFVCVCVTSMLERLLDSKLKEEESKQPLKLPSPDQYR